MSHWRNAMAHSWLLRGLPEKPETDFIIYTFNISSLQSYIPWEKNAIGLTIPEKGGSEEPKHEEQEIWIKRMFLEYSINAEYLGCARWKFFSEEDAIAFEKLLWQSGAFRLWTLQQQSKEPGVLIEYHDFTIKPSDHGTFFLSLASSPELPALIKRAEKLVRYVLSKYRIRAKKLQNPNGWEFETLDAAFTFEMTMQKMFQENRSNVFSYKGLR